MKTYGILLLLMLSLSTLVVAQGEDEDEPLPPPRKSGTVKFGGAGGFTQNILFLNLDEINRVLGANNSAPFDGNALLLTGGQGYGYIMVLPNLRIGGMGASGTRVSKSLLGVTVREVDLSVGFGGVTIDYVIPVVPRLDIAVGGLLGWGGMSLTMSRDDGTPWTWNGAWTDFGSPSSAQNYTRKLSGSFFVYQPNVNVEVALLRWLGLRIGAGYMGMAGNDWKVDDRYELLGVPDDVNGRGWMINGGIFVGTFLF